jgi:hypothetical protein
MNVHTVRGVHGPCRGFVRLFEDLFDTPICVATVRNRTTPLMTGKQHSHWLELLGFSNSHYGLNAVIPAGTAGIHCHGGQSIGCISG